MLNKIDERYDDRNKLNDLTGVSWLKLTRSFWVSKCCKDDEDAMDHPAPFLIEDIAKLISMFTKKEMKILDPFVGSGTSLIASAKLGRYGIGIDINEKYRALAIKRMSKLGYMCTDLFSTDKTKKRFEYLIGDANKIIPTISKVDYIVTSPPYHNILRNNGEGIRKEKQSKLINETTKQYVLPIDGTNKLNKFIEITKGKYRTGARTGVEFYSEYKNDLGNKKTYNGYLLSLKKIMQKGYDRLNNGKYCSIIISDFTVEKKEICVQRGIVNIMEKIGFEFCGTVVLLQQSKPLYPFGYPFAYKINHHHQNIINFRKIRNS